MFFLLATAGCMMDPPSAGDIERSDPVLGGDAVAVQAFDASDDPEWWAEVQQRIAAEEYRITEQAAGRWNATNRAHALRAVIEGGAATIAPRDDDAWSATLSVTGFGRREGVVESALPPSRVGPGECDEEA